MVLGGWERRWEGKTSCGNPTATPTALTLGPEGLDWEHRVPFPGPLPSSRPGARGQAVPGLMSIACLASAEAVQDCGPGGGRAGGNETMGHPHHKSVSRGPKSGVVPPQGAARQASSPSAGSTDGETEARGQYASC